MTGPPERSLAEYDALFAASDWQRSATHMRPGNRSILELRAAA